MFTATGFDVMAVHMSGVVGGTIDLIEFRRLAACGGFSSYGDVLGADIRDIAAQEGARCIGYVLRARRRICVRRVQRIPVPGSHERSHPRRAFVAASQGEQLGDVSRHVWGSWS